MRLSDTPRQSVVSGRFYPDDAAELREQVRTYLALQPQKRVELSGRDVLAVMVPHAGYVFSGPVAGMTLGQIDLPDRLIVLGPNHTGQGAAFSLWAGGAWQTPLGPMPTDTRTAAALVAAGAAFTPDMAAHIREHSLEVLVPFFQVMNPNAAMAAVTVGGGDIASLRAGGEALATVVSEARDDGGRVLLVISSDMSHYLPHEDAAKWDAMALEALCSLDAKAFYAVVRRNNISMCGVLPMTMALFALAKLGATRADVVAYATSGQTGRAFGAGMDKVVGYAGVIVSR